MKIDDKTGLVLEGGGMRGVFTCGVLDYMMDKKVWFPYGVGVSAGACNGLSYMSRQRGRAKFSNIDLLEKYHYIGIKHLWRKHSILDQELLYEHFPKEILPYDYKTYAENPARFEMVTPEEAYVQAQKALIMLSSSLNKGIEKVESVQEATGKIQENVNEQLNRLNNIKQ